MTSEPTLPADTARHPVVLDEDNSAWRAMCLWLAERDLTENCGDFWCEICPDQSDGPGCPKCGITDVTTQAHQAWCDGGLNDGEAGA